MKKTVKIQNPIRANKAHDSSGKRHRMADSNNPDVLRSAVCSQLVFPFWGSIPEKVANGSVYIGLAVGMAEDRLNEETF